MIGLTEEGVHVVFNPQYVHRPIVVFPISLWSVGCLTRIVRDLDYFVYCIGCITPIHVDTKNKSLTVACLESAERLHQVL